MLVEQHKSSLLSSSACRCEHVLWCVVRFGWSPCTDRTNCGPQHTSKSASRRPPVVYVSDCIYCAIRDVVIGVVVVDPHADIPRPPKRPWFAFHFASVQRVRTPVKLRHSTVKHTWTQHSHQLNDVANGETPSLAQRALHTLVVLVARSHGEAARTSPSSQTTAHSVAKAA